jgi:hypothetical protein
MENVEDSGNKPKEARYFQDDTNDNRFTYAECLDTAANIRGQYHYLTQLANKLRVWPQ